MEGELYDLIERSQGGNKDAILEIITRFNCLIKCISRKLKYDGSETDLVIFLIEIINKIPIHKDKRFLNDGCIVKYINNSMKNKFIYLSKQNCKIKNVELNTDILSNETKTDIEEKIIFSEVLDKLPDIQKKVIIYLYINDYTVSDAASLLHITRQAVNQAKLRAFKVIKNSINMGGMEYGK